VAGSGASSAVDRVPLIIQMVIGPEIIIVRSFHPKAGEVLRILVCIWVVVCKNLLRNRYHLQMGEQNRSLGLNGGDRQSLAKFEIERD
jgi:hypothetical protein